MTGILLVDDQPLVRSGIRMILAGDPDLIVVGECSDGDEVAHAVQALAPDMVVMDVRMRRINGDVATRQLRELGVHIPILILTTFSDSETVAAALTSGANGFLLKDAPPEDIIAAIRHVSLGESWLDRRISGEVLKLLQSAPSSAPLDSRLDALTPRERDVLREVATGATNAEIAGRLFIGEATVKTHLANTLAKLDLRDRAAAIVFALRHDIPQ